MMEGGSRGCNQNSALCNVHPSGTNVLIEMPHWDSRSVNKSPWWNIVLVMDNGYRSILIYKRRIDRSAARQICAVTVTMYTSHFTVCTLLCAVGSVLWTVCTLVCMYSLQYTISCVKCTVNTVQFIVYIESYRVLNAVLRVQFTSKGAV